MHVKQCSRVAKWFLWNGSNIRYASSSITPVEKIVLDNIKVRPRCISVDAHTGLCSHSFPKDDRPDVFRDIYAIMPIASLSWLLHESSQCCLWNPGRLHNES